MRTEGEVLMNVMVFNVEIVNSEFGDTTKAAAYCLEHICTRDEFEYFHDTRPTCPSNRNGECQMAKYIETLKR